MTRKKWFRILGLCPCCGMRVNVDRMTQGSGELTWEFFGHSVVNGWHGHLVNLIGPIKGSGIPNTVNGQIILRLVEVLAGATEDFPWLKNHIAEKFKLGGFVESSELDRPVEGIKWQNPEPATLQAPVQEPTVRDVTKAFSRIGSPAPTAATLSKKVHQESYLESQVTLDTPKEKWEEMLATLAGGKTKMGNGV